MLPTFDVEGGLALAFFRALSVGALLSVFGALLFRTVIAPPVLARMDGGAATAFHAKWNRLIRGSLLAAILASVAWLLVEAAFIGGADTMTAAVAAMPAVLTETSFGHVLSIRLIVLILTAFAVGRRGWGLPVATGLAAVATMLQAGHSHAASMYDGPSLLLVSELVHLLAAGAWLGGLAPLLLLVVVADPDAALLAARRFSPLGTICVVALAATASFQFWVLIGGLPGLIGTGYGLIALLKMVLFGLLLGLAGNNRFRLAPALATTMAREAKRHLQRSIAVETSVGLLVILAAGLLTNLPPAMHVQPIWPFAHRLSFDTIREDADFRLEVIQAGLALAGAVALLVLAALMRRLRWTLVAVALVIVWFAVPHLDLLRVEAYPTSFYRSPTQFAAASIADGAKLFSPHCGACHGNDGRGDGPAAEGMLIPPADLTASHLWLHSDGDLFWWLTHGIDAPDGSQVMPGFATALSEDERWELIDYIRAHNAGLTVSRTGTWSPPVQAPDLQAVCDGKTLTMQDFRGRFVRLVIGALPLASAGGGVVAIAASAEHPAQTSGCYADDESVPSAYAIVSGIPPSELKGTQFLIDDSGWLRALQRPGEAGSWNDPQALAAEVEFLRAHPVAAASGADDHMNMRM